MKPSGKCGTAINSAAIRSPASWQSSWIWRWRPSNARGARPKNEKEAEALGKLSVEIVGKEHDMNYKKVMRYIRLNSLVPELLDKVDTKQMGFMPAVEISYIRPENQRLIAVSIDGEQASPLWPRRNSSGNWIRKASSTAM